MALKVTVKVGNIVNLSDARYCAGMGVDLLGFPSTLTLDMYRDIRGWVTGPRVVLELAPEETDVPKLLESFIPDLILVTPVQAALVPSSVPVIFSGTAQEVGSLPDHDLKRAAYFQLSNGSISDLPVVRTLTDMAPVLVEWPGATVWDRLQQFPNCGLALQGSAEEKPGLTDFDYLSEILETLEISGE